MKWALIYVLASGIWDTGHGMVSVRWPLNVVGSSIAPETIMGTVKHIKTN